MNLKSAAGVGVGTIMLAFGIHAVTAPPPAIALPLPKPFFEILKTAPADVRATCPRPQSDRLPTPPNCVANAVLPWGIGWLPRRLA
jgi:hypothetical protein